MAKKKTKSKKEAGPQIAQDSPPLTQESAPSLQEAVQEVPKEPASPAQVFENKEEIDIHEAARRFVIGYKEHWYPSILRFAQGQGYTGPTTPDECKRILVLWGAKLQ